MEREFPLSSESPAIDPVHVRDDLEYEPWIASNDPLDGVEVRECPPPSPDDDDALSGGDDENRGVTTSIAVTACTALDAAKVFPRQHVQ